MTLLTGAASAAASGAAESQQGQCCERQRGRRRHGRGRRVGPVGRVVLAVHADDTRVTTEVVRLHDGGREATRAVDGVVRVLLHAVHLVDVRRASEVDREIGPGVVVDGHTEVHPCRAFPDAEARCAVVIGEADDGEVGDGRAIGHHTPHVGADVSVLGIGSFSRDPERRREDITRSTQDSVLPPLGVVEAALVGGRAVAQPIGTGDADSEDVATPMEGTNVAEAVRIVAVRHPARRGVVETRHH